MAVSMRPRHDPALLPLATAEQDEETVLQASQHLQLLALRRALAREAEPVGGTVARALVKRTFDLVVTGLSQIAFAEESRILDGNDPTGHYLDRILPQKMGMDRLYATRYHLRLDLSILVWTLIAVLARRDVAVHRQTGRMNLRRRPAPAEALPTPATPALALAPPGGQSPVAVEPPGDDV